jgi:plastocyanin
MVAALALSACSGATNGMPDGAAASGLDASSSPADAMTVGADSGSQSPTDASTGAVDAGAQSPADASSEPPDAAAAAGPDAGSSYPDCAASFAGCTNYTDATAAGANRTISFACCQYTPKCLKIAAGQSVTFSGSFGSHPLNQACGPAQVIVGASAANASFPFDLPGEYGFYCGVHGTVAGGGMAGSILVQ